MVSIACAASVPVHYDLVRVTKVVSVTAEEYCRIAGVADSPPGRHVPAAYFEQ